MVPKMADKRIQKKMKKCGIFNFLEFKNIQEAIKRSHPLLQSKDSIILTCSD
jgi:hypothetical protein